LRVGKIKVTEKDLGSYLRRYKRKYHLKRLTPGQAEKYVQNDLLDYLLFLNQAYAQVLDKNPKVLQKYLLMQKKYLTAGDGLLYRRFLQDSLGVTVEGIKSESEQDNAYWQQLEKVASELKKRLLAGVNIKINQTVFDEFYEKNYRSGYYFRKQIMNKFATQERAQLFFEYNSIPVTLGEWIDYYLSYPVVRIIENKDMLKEHIEQFIFEQIAYNYAKRMGLLNDVQFKEFSKLYKEKLMVDFYQKEIAYKKIAIDDREISAEYEKHKNKYKTEPIVGIITIEFLTEVEAKQIANTCKNGNIERFLKFKKKYESHIRTKKENIRYFTPLTIPYSHYLQIAFTMKKGAISSPIYISKQKRYLMIAKVAQISPRQLSLQEARQEIRNSLLALKYEGLKINLIHSFKKKYNVRMSNHRLKKYISQYCKIEEVF